MSFEVFFDFGAGSKAASLACDSLDRAESLVRTLRRLGWRVAGIASSDRPGLLAHLAGQHNDGGAFARTSKPVDAKPGIDTVAAKTGEAVAHVHELWR